MSNRPPLHIWIEQIAILFASFVWTLVVLSLLVFYWIYQGVQTSLVQVNLNTISAQTLEVNVISSLVDQPLEPVIYNRTDDTRDTSVLQDEITVLATPTLTPVPPPAILPETAAIGEDTPIAISIQPQPETIIADAPLDTTTADAAEINTVTDISQPLPSIPARLKIPAIGLDSDIIPVGWQLVEQNGVRYSRWDVANFAVGWHQTTAYLGQSGNTVFAGHNNINGEVFRDLPSVEVGDTIIAYADGKSFKYTVEMKTIVREKGEPLEVRKRNAQWISTTTDERLTLVSCWPYTSNTHRVIVVAKPG